jgi:hypothetical protein
MKKLMIALTGLFIVHSAAMAGICENKYRYFGAPVVIGGTFWYPVPEANDSLQKCIDTVAAQVGTQFEDDSNEAILSNGIYTITAGKFRYTADDGTVTDGTVKKHSKKKH